MKTGIDQALTFALARVQHIETQIAALNFACKDIRDSAYEPAAKLDFSALHAAMYRRLNDAYRDAAFFGLYTKNEKLRAHVEKIVWSRFFKEGMEIMSWLQPSGRSPNAYASTAHDKWRAELDALADAIGVARPKKRGAKS